MSSVSAPKAFRDLIDRASYKSAGVNQLTNLTFFVGSGFSKAWDAKAPNRHELFSFPKAFLEASPSEIQDLLTQPGYPTLQEANSETIREVVYQLTMQLKYPGIRGRYMDETSLKVALNELKALTLIRFEEVCGIPYYDIEAKQFGPLSKFSPDQKKIVEFFRWLRQHQSGDRGYLRGVNTDFLSTNYDFVIETILSQIVDADDPLRNMYRGITPTHFCGEENRNIIHDHWSIDTLIKINGGFEIIEVDDGEYELDYREREFADVRRSPPELMMPSKEQNYTNHYFSSIFPKAVRLLQESQILVIVGYSLSEDDALLRFLIRQFAEDVRDIHNKYIFYVDYLDESAMTTKLKACFRYINYMDMGNIHAYSGGLLRWIDEVFASSPSHTSPVPDSGAGNA